MGRGKKLKRRRCGEGVLNNDIEPTPTPSSEVHRLNKNLKTAVPSPITYVVSPPPKMAPSASQGPKVFTVAVTRIDLTDSLVSPMPDVFERYDCIDAMPLVSAEAQRVRESSPKIISDVTEETLNQPKLDADDDRQNESPKLDGTIPIDCIGWRTRGRCKKHNKNKCRYRHDALTRGADRKHLVQVIKTPTANASTAGGKSKKGGKRRYSYENRNAPGGDCGDGISNPDSVHTPDKYWAQRRRLFSKFDDGIRLDPESWYSVTPEVIADHTAHRVFAWRNLRGGSAKETFVLLDAFGGCGGNTIAFAKIWPGEGCFGKKMIICVDVDRQKLRKAANNAKIYGVDARSIVFVHGDAIHILEQYDRGKKKTPTMVPSKAGVADVSASSDDVEICCGYRIGGMEQLPDRIDLTFLSPPWGGVDYSTVGNNGFQLKDILVRKDGGKDGPGAPPVASNGVELLQLAAGATQDAAVIYFLPRNLNLVSLGAAAAESACSESGVIELEENWLKGKFKTYTAYMCVKSA